MSSIISMASDAVIGAAAPQIKHDVFVNFRGEDTRNNFVSHLLAALRRNRINAFTDDDFKGGEEISTTLSHKISESHVSVVVFSPNYADSRWCLDELVRILQCKGSYSQTVLPVFLQAVEPTHVRNQTGAFGDALGRLLQDGRYADKVESWRHSLKQVADLSGLDSTQISEDKIIERILSCIKSILDQTYSYKSSEYFIGIERVKEAESILFSLEIKCLGIWGMGGSGKTTFAKEIYARNHKHFDASCFIENVKEIAERHDLSYWRKSLLSQLLGRHDPDEGPFVIFHGDIQWMLSRKRVLIVLDDVSDMSQLSDLVGYYNLYCPGSKIIVTSRDKQVLKNGCDNVYKIQKLNEDESLQLLTFHIFKQQRPTQDQMELLKETIKYTQGLPLALTVVGCNLFGRDIIFWKSEVDKLSEDPDLNIMKILRTSFDNLEDSEKNIFLDIACVLKSWNKDCVEKILDACGFHATRGIERLVDKALITIFDQRIWMHDLVQQMGQCIALKGGIKETGKPSRLWRNKDIVNFLIKHEDIKVMKKIEVLSMDLANATSIKLKSGFFEQMTGLRILKFYNISSKGIRIFLPEGLNCLPYELRYMEWVQYPLPSLPSWFNPEYLVELHMVHSCLKRLWTGGVEPHLPNLKIVDLSYSKYLTTLPNFRNALKLEMLSISFCRKLKNMPNSIQHLVELKDIAMDDNTSLVKFPEISQLTKLQSLSLSGCSKIRHLPQLPQNLISLGLSLGKIKQLHSSLQRLSRLYNLSLDGCEELGSLPDNIGGLQNLKKLWLDSCPKLSILPASLSDLKSLEELSLRRCPKLVSLPANLGDLKSLEELRLHVCRKLSILPDSLGDLKSLKKLYLWECPKLLSLPANLGGLKSLYCLSIRGCPLNSLPASLNQLILLKSLECTGYKGDALPSLAGLVYLNRLELRNCNLKSLPEYIKYLPYLKEINLDNCESLSLIPALPPALFCLCADNCTSLKKYTRISSCHVDYRRPHFRPMQLTFGNCVNLDQDASNEIARDFWLRLPLIQIPLAKMVYPKKQEKEASSSNRSHSQTAPRRGPLSTFAKACFPGNEVPEWFEYSGVGSSLRVKNNFQGGLLDPVPFVFCTVVAFPHHLNPWPMCVCIRCKCLTSSGEYFDSECEYKFWQETPQSQRAHTFLWCSDFGSPQVGFRDATFQFSSELWFLCKEEDEYQCKRYRARMDGGEIVKCGVFPFGGKSGTELLGSDDLHGTECVAANSIAGELLVVRDDGGEEVSNSKKRKHRLEDDGDSKQEGYKRSKMSATARGRTRRRQPATRISRRLLSVVGTLIRLRVK